LPALERLSIMSLSDPNIRLRVDEMKLTRAASYALHAVVYIAGHQNGQKAIASHEIARARGIPERFLLKVLKPLVGANVLTSIKGPNGGYKLVRRLRDISMLDVVEAVDGPITGVAPSHRDHHLNGKLEAICNQSAHQVRRLLDKLKLADLAKK
jgi:Rrf2 family protein